MGISNNIGELDDVLRDVQAGGTLAVSTSEVEIKVGGSRLAGRECVRIFNKGAGTVYVGAPGTSVAQREPLYKNTGMTFAVGDISITAICDTGQSATLTVWEIG